MAIFRLTGEVVSTRDKSWSKNGRDGVMTFASVKVNDFVRTELLLSDALASEVHAGQSIDVIVDVYAAEGYIRASATGYWPREATALHGVKSA